MTTILEPPDPPSPSLAIRQMIDAGVWGIALTVAQRHGLQPRSLFEMGDVTLDARGETWSLMLAAGVKHSQIIAWWSTTRQHVNAALGAHARTMKRALPDADETKPGMVPGYGDRREDCATYTGCLDIAGKSSKRQCRCPDACSAYVPVRLSVIDYLKQKTAPEKHAAARSCGGGE